jgi:hypothetical protein
MPWAVSNYPSSSSEDDDEVEVPGDASLLKRQLNPTKRGKPARAHGANDPENIRIVNMRDEDGMRFDRIAAILNAERFKKGLEPKLTTNSVNGRYNRNAPLLYAASGRRFIPPGERRRKNLPRGGGHRENHGSDYERASQADVWTNDRDVELVRLVKEYEEKKWKWVADAMRDRTDVEVEAGQCAVRFGIL